MKNVPVPADGPAPVPDEAPHGFDSIVRFWACFLVCLVALGIISGLMLFGLFLLMGYHVF
jgi:hypothetical protein